MEKGKGKEDDTVIPGSSMGSSSDRRRKLGVFKPPKSKKKEDKKADFATYLPPVRAPVGRKSKSKKKKSSKTSKHSSRNESTDFSDKTLKLPPIGQTSCSTIEETSTRQDDDRVTRRNYENRTAQRNYKHRTSCYQTQNQAYRATRNGALAKLQTMNVNANTNVISKMNETPSVAVFDLRFKDSLPPIEADTEKVKGQQEDTPGNKQRGNPDGDEEEWEAESHYERYLKALHEKRKRILQQAQLEQEDSSYLSESGEKPAKTTDQNGNEGNLPDARRKPKKYKGIIRRNDYFSKEDLDLRPYAQRKHLINDSKLDNFLKKCQRRFRRSAVSVNMDDDENNELLKYAEDLATMFALKTCF